MSFYQWISPVFLGSKMVEFYRSRRKWIPIQLTVSIARIWEWKCRQRARVWWKRESTFRYTMRQRKLKPDIFRWSFWPRRWKDCRIETFKVITRAGFLGFLMHLKTKLQMRSQLQSEACIKRNILRRCICVIIKVPFGIVMEFFGLPCQSFLRSAYFKF